MLQRLTNWLNSVQERGTGADSAPLTSSDPVHLRALMVIFNPVIEAEGGRRLSEVLRWHNPDVLAEQYAADLHDASGGFARYEVVERLELDEWPLKRDGFRYDDDTFLRAWR